MRYKEFVSIISVNRNQADKLPTILKESTAQLSQLAGDYEFIIVDNASSDASVDVLKKATQQEGIPNIQVFVLTKEVDIYTAISVGIEHALGEVLVFYDPLTDDLKVLPNMLRQIQSGTDVIFAINRKQSKVPTLYKFFQVIFYFIYRNVHGIYLPREAPGFRAFSRKVAQFILQHPQPAIGYRHLPATGGFTKTFISFDYIPAIKIQSNLFQKIEINLRLLFSNTAVPLRFMSILCLFGAGFNFIYSIYVLLVAVFKSQVAAGWISISMQLSGMFFLFSLVQFVLGEYIIQLFNASVGGPSYHVGQDFSSVQMTRKECLNITEVDQIKPTLLEKNIQN